MVRPSRVSFTSQPPHLAQVLSLLRWLLILIFVVMGWVVLSYLAHVLGPILAALRGGVAVEPGTHRLELRHEDYFSSYLELTLVKAERKKVSMELAPILP